MGMQKRTSGEIQAVSIATQSVSRFVLLLILVVGIASRIGLAQEITIRLLDFRDGKPLQQRIVQVEYFDSDHRLQSLLSLKTDDKGVAQFSIPAPHPDEIRFAVPGAWFCNAGRSSIRIDEMTLRGDVEQGECKLGKIVSRPQPKPGEVTLFARPIPWWASIWGHILGS
jgi:hypothetical protein